MSRKKVLWVSEDAWAAASLAAKVSGEPLTVAASRLLLTGEARRAALAKALAKRRRSMDERRQADEAAAL